MCNEFVVLLKSVNDIKMNPLIHYTYKSEVYMVLKCAMTDMINDFRKTNMVVIGSVCVHRYHFEMTKMVL